jgi:hypothetical protein
MSERASGRSLLTGILTGMDQREFLRQLRFAFAGACLMVALAWFLVSARWTILALFG